MAEAPHPPAGGRSTAHLIGRRLAHYARPRQLQLALRMAELGTIQKAADAVGMSQPSATQALTQLESLLDLRLFDRHSRGVRLTREGALVMPTIQRVLASIDALARDAASVLEGAGGVVRIAGISAASAAIGSEALPALCAARPDLWIDYREVDAAQIPGLCSSGAADLLLCRPSTQVSAAFEYLPLRSDGLGVYCAREHPLARKRSVTLQACADATWLLPPEGSVPHSAFAQWCEHQQMTPRMARISTRSIPLTLALVRRLGYLYVGIESLMDSIVADHQLCRIALDIPVDLGGLGLLRLREGRTPAVNDASDHLLRWFGRSSRARAAPRSAPRQARSIGIAGSGPSLD